VKRWIFTILLFLLLGAIVNVAVALACALAGGRWDADTEVIMPEEEAKVLYVKWGGRLRDGEPIAGSQRFGVGATQSIVEARVSPTRRLATETITVETSGWPLRSLEGGYQYVWLEEDPEDADWYPGRAIMYWEPRGKVWNRINIYFNGFPLRPIWVGFLLNTFVYAAVIWLVIPGPFVLRRLIRIHRGRCPKCGYDLRGAPSGGGAGGGCPECGWNRPPEVTA
jgi:hypothetical protein